MTYRNFWTALMQCYDEGEAKAIARRVYEDVFCLSFAEICMGADAELSERQQKECKHILGRLLNNEPLQYVLGTASFFGRQFRVAQGVLIPRPETEELCQLCISHFSECSSNLSVLDIGTGSGCIAITLALQLPESKVEAWDISDSALAIASDNASRLNARVDFRKHDALNPPADVDKWDAIVSNPPYICNEESGQMEKNVLLYEPPTALFVPDDNPLLFYSAIARYAIKALRQGGILLFEINPRFASDMEKMLTGCGFTDIEIHLDQFSRERMISCKK